jgi:apolipoprotein N-acyltransferase
LFVLSEYSFASPIPAEVKAWCARHSRWLIVGGKEFIDTTQTQFRDTVFVIGPDGKEVFAQGKSRPIQFFDDGLPAKRQTDWNSPWGKIGLCVCYDLSYSRVTDELVRQGAQAIIVPTMDVEAWGGREHALHARVAPVRAAEYGVPIFRLASSGISQAVDENGVVVASASFPGQGQMLAATLALPAHGGHLPPDRFLTWPCMACVALLLGWQLIAWIRGAGAVRR